MTMAHCSHESYLGKRPSVALNAPWAHTWGGTQVDGGPHAYLPSGQMMMSSPQQLPLTGSQQGCVNQPGQILQCWSPYMSLSQLFPVSSWASGFCSGAGPAENSANAASYLQAQRPHVPVVLPAMVMVFVPQQPPQHPTPQSEGLRQRERKLIRIRDPNQDGRDVTEEIMSSLRSTGTARSHPQSSKALANSSQHHTDGPRAKKAKSRAAAEASLHPAAANKQHIVEAKPDLQTPVTPRGRWGAAAAPGAAGYQSQPTWDERPSPLPTSAAPSPKTASRLQAKAGGVALDAAGKTQEVESAPADRAPRVKAKKMQQARNLERGKQVAPAKSEAALEVSATVAIATATELEASRPPPGRPESAKPDPQSSPSPCSAEPPLSNGLPPDTSALSDDVPLSDSAPEASYCPESYAAPAAATAQEGAEGPLEVPPAELSAEVADDSGREMDDTECNEQDWIHIAPGNHELTAPGERRRYGREFLLALQFVGASVQKTQGLPCINGVILDKVNESPLPPADPARLMLFWGNLKSKSASGPRGTAGLRRSQQVQKKEPRKANSSSSLNDEVQLNKAENAWKPSPRKAARGRPGEEGEAEDDDLQQIKTRRLFKRLRTILNRLTPDNFQQLMKQVHELTIDSEQRLRGAINLIFERAISEPNLSEAHANMCRFLTGLKVPSSDKPDVSVNFRSLLLDRCQKEFEREKNDSETLDRKQSELDSAKDDEELECQKVELEAARGKARRRSLGSTKFIGELFKLKMLTVPIMDHCVMKLLKDQDEGSLDCLCWLFLKIGKNLDFKKAKPRMDQYLDQIDSIIKDEKTSSPMCLKLQEIMDLRQNNWEPQSQDQAAQTKDQNPKETTAAEKKDPAEVSPHPQPGKEAEGRTGVTVGGCVPTGGGGTTQPQDEAWSASATSRRRPADGTNLRKITKPGAPETNDQQVTAGGRKEMWGKVVGEGWGGQGPGSSATSSFNHSSGLQRAGLSPPAPLSHQIPQSHWSTSGCERGDDGDWRCRDADRRVERLDRRGGHESQSQPSNTSYAKESARDGDAGGQHKPSSAVPGHPADGTPGEEDMGSSDIGSGDRGSIHDLKVKLNRALTIHSLAKPVIKKEEVEKRSISITDDYIHMNNLKNMKFSVGGDIEPKVAGRKVFTEEELTRELDRLLQERANNQQIKDWVEANLDEVQTASNHFVRALMTSVCQSAIICDKLYRVDAQQITQRASLLQVYLCDEQKELQALYALQALMVDMEQSANLQRMFFDALCDEDVIMEEAFYKWESSINST